MNLPQLTIPHIPLPFEPDTLMHPCIIHMAIALPIVIVILEIINLFVKKRAVGIISFVFMLLLSAVVLMAYLTGSKDISVAGTLLDPTAKELLATHKQIGIYLVYASVLLVLLKLLSVMIRNTPMRITFLLFLTIYVAATANTAKKGKSLVYEYGINVKQIVPTKKDTSSIVNQKSINKTKEKIKEPESKALAETATETPIQQETKETKTTQEVTKAEDTTEAKEADSQKEVTQEATQNTEPETPIQQETKETNQEQPQETTEQKSGENIATDTNSSN